MAKHNMLRLCMCYNEHMFVSTHVKNDRTGYGRRCYCVNIALKDIPLFYFYQLFQSNNI